MVAYYFLTSILPELDFDTPSEITFEDFTTLLDENLTKSDYAKTEIVRRFYDIQNLRALWKGQKLDPRSNLNESELTEALLLCEGLPEYVYEYVIAHESLADRLHYFPSLVCAFFREEQKSVFGFLKEYLQFEREWRLVVAGFRAKQLGRSVVVEMQYEDPDDPLVAQILAQKDSKSYVPPEHYQDLAFIFEEAHKAPLALHQALCEYRFKKIEELLGVAVFSIDRVLGYMAELIIVEDWHGLDKEQGMVVVAKILGS